MSASRFCLLLERIVPEGGEELPDGPYLRAGTHVGMHAWVVHLDELFGPDPQAFASERWLQHEGESKEDHAARVRDMHDGDLTSGAGRRMCSDECVALVEICEVLVTLFYLYEIELVDPERAWKVTNTCQARSD